MSEEVLQKIDIHLKEILSPEQGLFGRVNTWGQRPTEYEYVGYVLSEDFLPTLRKMSPEKIKLLKTIIIYFKMHMQPLKKLLDTEEKEYQNKFFSDVAWSHFATLIMFGMLEIAIKGQRGVYLSEKGTRIKKFLEDNLSDDIKNDVAKRYKVDKLFIPKKPINNFGSVVNHMWEEVRGGFVHDAGIQYRGMEWTTLNGIGSKEDPIRVSHDVPMQEWLQITLQAILNSFGYKGVNNLPKYNRANRRISK